MGNNVFLKFLHVMMVVCLAFSSVCGGGLPQGQGNDDMARELAQTQNDLEDQKLKAQNLENEIGGLKNRINDLESRPPQVVETRITERTTGFGDFPVHGYFAAAYADNSAELQHGSFDQQTLHFLFEYELDDRFTFFADLGYNNGAEISVDLGELEGVGDVYIDEAYLDWKIFEDKLVLRFGKFYSNFGYWIVEETAPSTHSVFDPLIVNWSLQPVTTTGIMEYGQFEISSFILEHSFYVGNGRTDRPHSRDENSNKAIGSRVGLVLPIDNEEDDGIRFGISGFYGRDSSEIGNFQEKIWSFDTKFDYSRFTLRGEVAKSRLNVDDFSIGEEGHIWKNSWFIDGSVRIFEKWHAFLRHDFADDDFRFIDSGDLDIDSVGLAYRPIPAVVFKAQYDRYDFDQAALEDYNVVSAQCAVRF